MKTYWILQKENGQLYLVDISSIGGRANATQLVRKGDVLMGHIKSDESVMALTEGFQTEVKLQNLELQSKLERLKAYVKEV